MNFHFNVPRFNTFNVLYFTLKILGGKKEIDIKTGLKQSYVKYLT